LVFHLAASVGNKRSIDNPREDADINLSGTIAVLEAARKNGIGRIVFSSSAGIFGELKTLPIAEDHPQDPDSPYGVSKLAAEKACLVYNKLYGMRNVCLRYFNVYGIRQRFDAYGNVIPIFAERMLRNESLTIYGDGEQTRDFVNVGDVVSANLAAATSETAAGAFNIGSSTRISINELVRKMQQHHGRTASVVHGPERAGDVRHSLADVTQATRAFGYAARVEIDSGLAQYLEWLAQDPITRARWQRQA
jgi:UDP-glucose 4-epimerase